MPMICLAPFPLLIFSPFEFFLSFCFGLVFFPLHLQQSASISMQAASLELVLLLPDCVLSAKDKNPMSETGTTFVRQAVMSLSMTLRGPSGEFWDTGAEFTFGGKRTYKGGKPSEMLIGWHLSSCRCLKDGVADVAFLDHLRIMSATGNHKNAVFF